MKQMKYFGVMNIISMDIVIINNQYIHENVENNTLFFEKVIDIYF